MWIDSFSFYFWEPLRLFLKWLSPPKVVVNLNDFWFELGDVVRTNLCIGGTIFGLDWIFGIYGRLLRCTRGTWNGLWAVTYWGTFWWNCFQGVSVLKLQFFRFLNTNFFLLIIFLLLHDKWSFNLKFFLIESLWYMMNMCAGWLKEHDEGINKKLLILRIFSYNFPVLGLTVLLFWLTPIFSLHDR